MPINLDYNRLPFPVQDMFIDKMPGRTYLCMGRTTRSNNARMGTTRTKRAIDVDTAVIEKCFDLTLWIIFPHNSLSYISQEVWSSYRIQLRAKKLTIMNRSNEAHGDIKEFVRTTGIKAKELVFGNQWNFHADDIDIIQMTGSEYITVPDFTTFDNFYEHPVIKQLRRIRFDEIGLSLHRILLALQVPELELPLLNPNQYGFISMLLMQYMMGQRTLNYLAFPFHGGEAGVWNLLCLCNPTRTGDCEWMVDSVGNFGNFGSGSATVSLKDNYFVFEISRTYMCGIGPRF